MNLKITQAKKYMSLLVLACLFGAYNGTWCRDSGRSTIDNLIKSVQENIGKEISNPLQYLHKKTFPRCEKFLNAKNSRFIPNWLIKKKISYGYGISDQEYQGLESFCEIALSFKEDMEQRGWLKLLTKYNKHADNEINKFNEQVIARYNGKIQQYRKSKLVNNLEFKKFVENLVMLEVVQSDPKIVSCSKQFKQQDVGQENCFPDECHLKILKAFMDMAKRKINEKRFDEMNDL